MREKLIELLEQAESAIYWNSEDKSFVEKIADHLIANGVTVPVRCKECKKQEWCSFRQRLMYEFGVEDGFCSAGEMKDNGNPRDR